MADDGDIPKQLLQLCQAVRKLEGDIAAGFLAGKLAGDKGPISLLPKIDEERRLALGIVSCCEQDIGVKENSLHGCALSLFLIA